MGWVGSGWVGLRWAGLDWVRLGLSWFPNTHILVVRTADGSCKHPPLWFDGSNSNMKRWALYDRRYCCCSGPPGSWNQQAAARPGWPGFEFFFSYINPSDLLLVAGVIFDDGNAFCPLSFLYATFYKTTVETLLDHRGTYCLQKYFFITGNFKEWVLSICLNFAESFRKLSCLERRPCQYGVTSVILTVVVVMMMMSDLLERVDHLVALIRKAMWTTTINSPTHQLTSYKPCGNRADTSFPRLLVGKICLAYFILPLLTYRLNIHERLSTCFNKPYTLTTYLTNRDNNDNLHGLCTNYDKATKVIDSDLLAEIPLLLSTGYVQYSQFLPRTDRSYTVDGLCLLILCRNLICFELMKPPSSRLTAGRLGKGNSRVALSLGIKIDGVVESGKVKITLRINNYIIVRASGSTNMSESGDKHENTLYGEDPELDWDNFFPCVEFCDSGSETEHHDSAAAGVDQKISDGLSLSPEWNHKTSSESTGSYASSRTGRFDPPAAKSALCYPSELSPPPLIGKKEKDQQKPPNTKLITRAAKKTQRAKDETTKRTYRLNVHPFTWRDQDIESGGEENARRKESGIVKNESKVPMNHPLTAKKHKRSSSLGDSPCEVDGTDFSITAMVAEADERDFLRPKIRKATSKPSLLESSGPLLSSTIDLDESKDEKLGHEEADVLRGGKNKSESLKESFKKRGPSGQFNDDNRNRSDAARRGRRNDKFDEHRNLHEDNNPATPSQNNESTTSKNLFTTPTEEEMEANMSFNSPIISSSRRGRLMANWADTSMGSDFTIQSEGKVGGPKRKTRRGKKKKRNQSVSISDTSLTSSFKATLQGREETSFDMDGSQPQTFSGTARNDTRNNDYPAGKNGNSNNRIVPYTETGGASPKDSFALATRKPADLQTGPKSDYYARSTPMSSGPSRRPMECPVLARISEMVRAGNPYEGDGDGLDLDDSRVIDCDVGYSVQRNKRDHLPQLDQSQEVDLNLLLPNACKRTGTNRKFKARGMIQFVIMRRPEGSGDEWEFFPRKSLENLINAIEGRNASSSNGLSGAFKFANMWGVVPLLGLYSTDMGLLTGYRHQVELYNDVFEYQTFPREALDRRLALTIML